MQNIDYRDQQMSVENVSLAEIANTYQTPVYVYSQAEIEANISAYKQALSNLNHTICYAVKANSNQAVLSIIAQAGLGADVVSEGELKRALLAGIPASKIVFSGVGKSAQEMTYALEQGILQFNVESQAELLLLNEVALANNKIANVALRVNPDVEAKTHKKITTGKSENKFGIDYKIARQVYNKAASLSGINIQGVDVHIGSQILELAPYKTAFSKVATLVQQLVSDGHNIRFIDVGGGVGITYSDEDNKPNLLEYADHIQTELGQLNCHIIVEPGRSIVASAGVLLSTVDYVKYGTERTFAIIDAAMNDFARPSMYDAYHKIQTVNEAAINQTYDIVGPVCETGDTFAEKREMPALQQGDLVVIRDTGAYGAVMSSTYNTRPLIPEVLVRGNQHGLIKPRQSIDSLIALDVIPNWF